MAWVPNRHCDNPNFTDDMKKNCVVIGTYTPEHQNDYTTHITYYLSGNKLYSIKGYRDSQTNRKTNPKPVPFTELLMIAIPVPHYLVPHFLSLAKVENLMASYVIVHDTYTDSSLEQGDILVYEQHERVREIMTRLYGNVLLTVPQRYATPNIDLTIEAINKS